MSGIFLGDKPTKTKAVVNADEIPLLDSEDLSSGRKKVKKVTAANLKASILAEQPKVLIAYVEQEDERDPIIVSFVRNDFEAVTFVRSGIGTYVIGLGNVVYSKGFVSYQNINPAEASKDLSFNQVPDSFLVTASDPTSLSFADTWSIYLKIEIYP